MEEKYWKLSFFGLFLVWFSIRTLFGKGSLKIKTKIRKRVVIEKILVTLNFFGMMFLPLYVVFSLKLDYATMHLSSFIRWIALCVYALNLGLFAWCHISLGKNWSNTLEIKKDQKLIKEGPYRKIRHPMYTHFWLLIISQGLLLNNWIVLVYGVFAWGLLYLLRVPKEEEMMIEEFGEEYRKYMEETGKLLPKFL